jgi:hypothetical protein
MSSGIYHCTLLGTPSTISLKIAFCTRKPADLNDRTAGYLCYDAGFCSEVCGARKSLYRVAEAKKPMLM